ncbi:DUF2145 domain-containing protein [Leeia sp. TBRC 13508]|uniref:DUF2145 domain-containing protein n=1 Tax=Leeia speluncae TaxID=2884804 RepID=A0ABS8D8N5_9NEIS|nr:DUF2145 domain-containing protein [Leeia speluncae]MCB6183993.1 DUF2145 domain-containing protein [Leeia speluncae]
MKKRLGSAFLFCGLFITLFSTSSWAGRNCAEVTISPEKTVVAFDGAMRLQSWLNQRPEIQVAALARRGQNLDDYGVKYSHVAFLVKESDGQWRTYHELNKCQSDSSNLFMQGLPEFFADDLLNQEIAIAVFNADVSAKLMTVLHDNSKRFAMHQSKYSAVAYPFGTKYQNSDGWIIETFLAAVSPIALSDREQVQSMLKVLKYEPSILKVGALKRLGGRMFTANVAFDDHPSELRWSDQITTHTGDSLMRFFNAYASSQVTCQASKLGDHICELDVKSLK